MKTSLWITTAALMLATAAVNADSTIDTDIPGMDWGFEDATNIGSESEPILQLNRWTMTGWNHSGGEAIDYYNNDNTSGMAINFYNDFDVSEGLVVNLEEGNLGQFGHDDGHTEGYMALTSSPFQINPALLETGESGISYGFGLNMSWSSSPGECDYLYVIAHEVNGNMDTILDGLYADVIQAQNVDKKHAGEIWTNEKTSNYDVTSYDFVDSAYTSGYFLQAGKSYALTVMLTYDGYNNDSDYSDYSNFNFDYVIGKEMPPAVPAPASVVLAAAGVGVSSVVRRYRR